MQIVSAYSLGNSPIKEKCISISCDCFFHLCPGALIASCTTILSMKLRATSAVSSVSSVYFSQSLRNFLMPSDFSLAASTLARSVTVSFSNAVCSLSYAASILGKRSSDSFPVTWSSYVRLMIVSSSYQSESP